MSRCLLDYQPKVTTARCYLIEAYGVLQMVYAWPNSLEVYEYPIKNIGYANSELLDKIYDINGSFVFSTQLNVKSPTGHLIKIGDLLYELEPFNAQYRLDTNNGTDNV